MDQIRYVPQAGNQKKKGGKAPQGRLLRLRPRPSAAEDKGNDHTRQEAEDMLKRTCRVSSGALAASIPWGSFHQEVYNGGKHRRPWRGKTQKPMRGKALRERHLLLVAPSPWLGRHRGIPRQPQGRYGRLPHPLEREPVVQLAQSQPMAPGFLNAGKRLAEGAQ
jgi:hypothetical protein